ncbi:pectinesterase family protein [Bacteroides sp. GD17]|uniref:pectinesterase family protein n=1 Tax=Bacteroides sp. GD17 TaxID=3139826 RepID=UPI0025CEDDAE|nr:pectinesterase family protein [uncultured Bacteroides sp.]
MKKNSICKFIVSGLLLAFPLGMSAQRVSSEQPWSVRMVESEMIRCPESWQLDFQPRLKWDYCHGLELQSMLDVYDRYGNKKIYDYALAYADTMVNADGTIKMYKREEFSLDRINSGKFIFRIYEQTKDEKYKKALALMRSQLDDHPRNEDGGFWHKKIYPHQVWLDGVYMGAPFYAEYAYRNNQVEDYADVINQFLMAARHTYDPKTDLYRHACDVSRKERWADPETGQSQHSWGRAMGWYAMAFVDALDFIPQHEPGRDSMLVTLNHLAAMVKREQDPKTGLWYQVLDKSGAEGNYLESSCSTMFVYTLFKAVRKGYIDKSYLEVAIKGYKGILDNFIEVDKDGVVSITQACAVAGLGGKNYRSGDYDYYIHETIRSNDPKAVGPFILASLEWERLPHPQTQWKRNIVVARDGSGDYRTLTEAMEGIRAFMDYKVTVFIKNGTYKEKVIVPSWIENVDFVGESVENTVITYDDHANINKMGTFRTYTVKVEGSGITFKNLTIENNAAHLGQAVALHTEGDRLMFINCRFLGNQDTIYTGAAGTRLHFQNCYIEGTTDFIFGPSTALFEGCAIHSKSNSYVTAASTPANIEVGYVFKNCKLTADASVEKVYLGRPWRPYAATVFINCELGKHICPAGWENWRNPENEKTARYAEYGSTGEGASTEGRVKWAKQLTKKEAAKYDDMKYVFGMCSEWTKN